MKKQILIIFLSFPFLSHSMQSFFKSLKFSHYLNFKNQNMNKFKDLKFFSQELDKEQNNDRTNKLQRLLRKAIARDKVKLAEKLIKAGAPINKQDKGDMHEDYPIVRATYRRQNNVIKLLVEKGANLDVSCEHGHTPLLVAIPRHNIEIVDFLIKSGADINKSDEDGNTPLIEACNNFNEKIVNLLLFAKADINKIDNEKNTALIKLLKQNGMAEFKYNESLKIIEHLIECNIDINKPNNNGDTALMIASLKSYSDIVSLLLKAGAHKETINNAGESALSLALNMKMEEEKLLERYQEIIYILEKARDNFNRAPSTLDIKESSIYFELFLACWEGDIETIKDLLKTGININIIDKFSDTPLIKSAAKGHSEIVKLLIKAGADTEYENSFKETALIRAIWWQEYHKNELKKYNEIIAMLMH